MFICVKDRFNFRNGKSCGDIRRADVRRSPPLPRAEGGAAAVGHESRRDFFDPSLAGFPFFTIFTYAKSSNVPKLRIIVGCMAGFCLLVAGLRVRAQPPHGVAFYDADCLYDTVPSPFGNDTRYLPQGEMRWTGERYRRKVMQTAAVIDSLGLPLVGLYGVENESVVRDVAAACKGDYAYLFRTTDSYNGLDFALFYFGDRFFPDRVEAGHFWMTAAGELRGAGRVCLLMSASDRYIGYKIEGTAGAAASTVAVCLPSFAVIYLISLFFDQFLRLSVVASAFHGIQVCVIYLILSAGLKMLKELEHSVFNIVILTTVAAAMVGCSIAAVSFSSIFYILFSGAAGLLVYAVQQLRKGEKKP